MRIKRVILEHHRDAAPARNQILAMSVLALTPSLVVFFMAQKYFIEGISTGGVKG